MIRTKPARVRAPVLVGDVALRAAEAVGVENRGLEWLVWDRVVVAPAPR